MIDLSALQTWCEGQHAWSRELLETLVRLESPSHDKAAVDRCGADCSAGWKRAAHGARGSRRSIEATISERTSPAKAPQTLILGHFDTVGTSGRFERMPLVRRTVGSTGPASST